jgi:ubiquinol-cytochrome c reductase cytochrome b subunit
MVVIGRVATLYYFVHFLVLLPLLGIFEQPRPLPQSISKPVLRGGGTPAAARAKPMEKA